MRAAPTPLTLPFTGFDVTMLAAGGLLLGGIGMSLRRATLVPAA